MIKGFRAKRRPGNRAPTKAEAARIVESKESKCIPCLVWADKGNMPHEHVAELSDYNHSKSGNLRVSHAHGYAGCGWHHRGLVPCDWTRKQMRDYFGPSLTDGSVTYREAYGTEAELIQRQTDHLAGLD